MWEWFLLLQHGHFVRNLSRATSMIVKFSFFLFIIIHISTFPYFSISRVLCAVDDELLAPVNDVESLKSMPNDHLKHTKCWEWSRAAWQWVRRIETVETWRLRHFNFSSCCRCCEVICEAFQMQSLCCNVQERERKISHEKNQQANKHNISKLKSLLSAAERAKPTEFESHDWLAFSFSSVCMFFLLHSIHFFPSHCRSSPHASMALRRLQMKLIERCWEFRVFPDLIVQMENSRCKKNNTTTSLIFIMSICKLLFFVLVLSRAPMMFLLHILLWAPIACTLRPAD